MTRLNYSALSQQDALKWQPRNYGNNSHPHGTPQIKGLANGRKRARIGKNTQALPQNAKFNAVICIGTNREAKI